MLMALIVLVVLAIALLRGGSLYNLTTVPLRWVPLVLIALGVQLLIFTPFRATPLISIGTPVLYLLSMGLLIIWVALNRHIPGMGLMAIGLLMNFAAISANGGYMPVDPELARYTGQIRHYQTEGLPVANNSIASDEGVRLWLLTDILPVPPFIPFASVLSIGDVFLTIGASLFVVRTLGTTMPIAETQIAPKDQQYN